MSTAPPPPPPEARPPSTGAVVDGTTPAGDPARPRRRLVGVDVARALAIVGMVAVHVLPTLVGRVEGPFGWPYGRASTLFAVVAGVGIALQARRDPPTTVRARLWWRAAWLLPAGVALQLLPHPVAVILQAYAVWFGLTALVVTWSSRALLALTGIGVLVGPTVLEVAQVLRPGWYDPAGLATDADLLRDVLLTGYYPTVSWWWLVLAGVLVGRLDLARTRVQAALLVAGGVVAVATTVAADAAARGTDLGRWRGLLDTAGHADTTVETVAAGAVAVAVLGGCLLLADVVPRVLAPLVALGRTALTFYVGHVVLYALAPSLLAATTVPDGARVTLWLAVLGALGAMVWLRWRPRGPLEALDRAGFETLVRPLLDAGGPRR